MIETRQSLMSASDPTEFLTDLSDFLQIIDRVMLERGVKPFDLDRFVASPTWRTRLRDLPFNPEGILGRKTHVGAYDMVAAALHEALKELREQQSNGDWAVAAYEVVRTPMRVRERLFGTRSPVTDHTVSTGDQLVRVPPSMMRGDSVEEGFVTRMRVVVNVAFIDLNEGTEMDMWLLRTGKNDSPMRDGKLSTRMVDEQNRSRELILKYYRQAQERLKLTPEEAKKAKRLSDRGIPADEIAEVLGRTPAAVVEALAEVAPEPEKPSRKRS